MTTPTNDDLDQLLGGNGGDGQPPAEGGKLRQLLEQALAENKQLREQTAQLATRERERDIQALFTKHSIPPLAKDLFPKDGDVTDEAATALVEKYGQLWGAQAAEAATTPEQQAAAAAVQALSAVAGSQPAGLLTEEAARAKFSEAKTAEDIMRMTAEAVQGYSVVME